MYKIIKYKNMLEKDFPTNFLDPKEQKELKKILKKGEYKIYSPYKDSEKKIFYKERLPKVILYEIICKAKIRHQDILGSLFALNIDKSLFGDVLVIDDKYFFYTLDMIKPYIEGNLTRIKKTKIELEERNLETLKDYEITFEKLNIIVASSRIDLVISRIIKTNRDKVKDLIKEKSIFLNYDVLKDNSYKLKENDIFSIRRYGKYKYSGVKEYTKKNHLVIEILKYK